MADQDLTFEFRLSSGALLQGAVQYVGAPGFAADFNASGGVNGADLTVWKGGFGRAVGAGKANGDYNLDGDVDGADFLGWQREVGLGVALPLSWEPSPSLPRCCCSRWPRWGSSPRGRRDRHSVR